MFKKTKQHSFTFKNTWCQIQGALWVNLWIGQCSGHYFTFSQHSKHNVPFLKSSSKWILIPLSSGPLSSFECFAFLIDVHLTCCSLGALHAKWKKLYSVPHWPDTSMLLITTKWADNKPNRSSVNVNGNRGYIKKVVQLHYTCAFKRNDEDENTSANSRAKAS